MRSLFFALGLLAVVIAALIGAGFLSIDVHYPSRHTVATAQGADRSADTPRDALREAERRKAAREREALDALRRTNVEIALEIQRWVEEPLAYGGGGGYFAGVTLKGLGYRVGSAHEYVSMDGTFRVEAQRRSARVVGENLELGLQVVTEVFGTNPEDIMTAVGALYGAMPSES